MIRLGLLTDDMEKTLEIMNSPVVMDTINRELPNPIEYLGAEFYNERIALQFGNKKNPKKGIFLESYVTDDIRNLCKIALAKEGIAIVKFHFMREGIVNSPVTAEPEPEKIGGKSVPKSAYDVTGTYKIKVKRWMLEPTEPGSDFDYMEKWNNNIPMPLMIMVGDKVKETKPDDPYHGMIFFKLHGDITSTLTQHCLRCGQEITNPVSQYFGMGPKCGHHNYTNPFATEEELYAAVNKYRKYLQSLTWEGWVAKSAIVEMEKLV